MSLFQTTYAQLRSDIVFGALAPGLRRAEQGRRDRLAAAAPRRPADVRMLANTAFDGSCANSPK